MNNTAILIMAAGSSRRFGGDKRRAIFEGEKTLLQATLENTAPWKQAIRVILAPGDERLRDELNDQQITAYMAAHALQGMGHSLADAIDLLSINEPDIDRCLVMLADMPFLKTSTIETLLHTLQTNELVVPTFEGKRGNPVGFGRRYFSDLKALTGDKGGKIIVQQHTNSVTEIAVDDEGILKDIDRPEQLTRS